ncbi:MAG TPA: type II toxin-antitoxin system HicB family antitoxin [Acidobacteriaceae bacterium]|nr:type II toxin-antitoxin system HicB family antitoxin [Acidobacteriaceae bacterium]
MKKTYMVVFERAAEDNWGAWVPDVPGAVGAGDSRESVRERVLQGVQIMLDDLNERGLAAPEPVSTSVDFSEFDPQPSSSHYEVEWLTVPVPGRVSPGKATHAA